MAVEFNADKHEYRIDGSVIPSVTQVIGTVLPGWQASQTKKDRGTAVHRMCSLLDDNKLEWDLVSKEIEGRVHAWRHFREDFPSTTVLNETSLAHPIHRYAGTLDRLLEIGKD